MEASGIDVYAHRRRRGVGPAAGHTARRPGHVPRPPAGGLTMRVLLVQAPSVEGPPPEIVAPLGLGGGGRGRARRAATRSTCSTSTWRLDAPDGAASALERRRGGGRRPAQHRPLANRRHSYLPAFAAVLETVDAASPAAPVVAGGAGFSHVRPRDHAAVPRASTWAWSSRGSRPSRRCSPRSSVRTTRVAATRGGPAGDMVRASPARRPADPGSATAPGTAARAPGVVAGSGRGRAWPRRTGPRAHLAPALASAYRGRTAYAPAAGVETKRGCPLRCSYCVYPALQGRRLRFRSPATIARRGRAAGRRGRGGVGALHRPGAQLPRPGIFASSAAS